jgi:hypothetical protein
VTAYVIPAGQEAKFLKLASSPPTTGCELSGASIDKDHVDGTYVCGDVSIVATFVHPTVPKTNALVAGDFGVSFEPPAPLPLRTWLDGSLKSAAGTWIWQALPDPPSTSASAPSPLAEPIPVDPRFGRAEHPKRTDAAARALPVLEASVTVLCLVALVVALIRMRATRRDGFIALALFVLALGLRVAVPWVPANYYTDLDIGVPNYSYNREYIAPIHSLFRAVHLPISGLVLANVLLGSVAVALFYLGLRDFAPKTGVGGGTSSFVRPDRVALVFSMLVATGVTFIRISASDAPHIVALAWLAASVVLLGRVLKSSSRAWLVALVGSCWLVGAARRELALAPIGLMALTLLATESTAAKRRAIAATVVGVGLGATATPIAFLGTANVDIGFHKEWALIYLRLFHVAAAATFDGLSVIVPVGLALMVLAAIATRRPQVVLGYLVLLASQTWIYAVSPFAAAIDHPLESWALARYALLWLLVTLYFVSAGVTFAWSFVRARSKSASYALVVVVCGVAISNYRGLMRLHGYQHEYLFLRASLPQVLPSLSRELPIVVVWQKSGGIDYCESLAVPHYGFSPFTKDREVLALPTSIPLETYFDRLPPRFVYFRNLLSQVDVTQLAGLPPETRQSLEEAQRTDCVLRTGQPLAAWRDLPVTYIQLPLRNAQHGDLELWLVDKEEARRRFAACGVAR